ncbi:MAG: glycosyltransferase family 4 protein [Candidatus Promineofilum sp.]|nr:glycosyltransferase family 4 protein [Promineifilum sp.]
MSAAPRVLMLGLTWPPETFLMRLIDGLVGRGLRVTVAVPAPSSAARRAAAVHGVEWVWLPGRTDSRPRNLWQTTRALAGAARRAPGEARRLVDVARAEDSAFAMAARLRRESPLVGRDFNVLYFPWNSAAIAYQELLDRAPVVISCRGSQINVAPHNPERADLRDGLAATFARAAAVHCVSAQIRDEATRYGLDPRKAIIIRPAVDPELFRPAVPTPFGGGLGRGSEASDTPLRLVSTGSILWRKGYEYALLAVRALLDRGVPTRFDIVGDGPEAQRLLYTIDDLALQEHVVWHGRRPPGEVLNLLQAADAFLLTSLSEGISNAVLEAMACGLPVVTTDVDGMSEAVTDGVEGFLVPPRDPAATADALAALAALPALRRTMGAAGRERVQSDFALDDQIDAFVDLFVGVAR